MNLDNQENKGAVIVSQGHYYMFSATGRYYINQLSRKYIVDLIVPEEYSEIDDFHATLSQINVRTVFFLKETVYFKKRNNTGIERLIRFLSKFKFSKYIRFNREAKQIFSNQNYVAYISNDYIEAEHIYLFHHFKANFPDRQIFVMLSSQPGNVNIFTAFAQHREANLRKISKGSQFIYIGLRLVTYSAQYVGSVFQNIIYPLLLLGVVRPYLGTSVFNNIEMVPKNRLFDVFFVHEDEEFSYHEKLFGHSISIQKVNHALTSESALLPIFFGARAGGKSISIFFSTLGLIGDKQLAIEMAEWNTLITGLLVLAPGYDLNVKFHPSSPRTIIDSVTASIKELSGNAVSFYSGSSVSAENLIFHSDIVIGDVSSTLIWAQYLPGKRVFSLQIGAHAMNADMDRYPNVICSKSSSEILDRVSGKIDLSPIVNPTIMGENPSMTEIVSDHVTRSSLK